MNYSIRPMRFSDIEQIYRIECQVFPNPWPRSFFENDLNNHNTIALVAEENDRIVGYGIATCAAIELHITNIAVDPEYQNRGIGKKLLTDLEMIGVERECLHAYLEVRVTNTIAIEFYKMFQYKIVQIRKGYYLNGTDAYVMAKELKEVL